MGPSYIQWLIVRGYPCMYVLGRSIRNDVFEKVFCLEAQEVTVSYRIFLVSQHWTVRQWRANPMQVTVTEMYCQVRSKPVAGRVMTILAVALRGSIRCCKHHQTKIPSDALNPNHVLKSQQNSSLSLCCQFSKPSLGGLDWIALLC